MAKTIENKGRLSLFEYGWALRYGVAPMMVALGLAIRSLLAPVLTSETVYTYFVPSVLVSAWFGGLGPGLVATVLSVFAATFLLTGAPNLATPSIVNGDRLCPYWSGRFVGRRIVAPKPAPHDGNDPRCIGARSSFAVNSGHGARRQ